MFLAHNGAKFDYKFIYESLYSSLGDMKLVGSMEQTKACIGQGLIFIDTALVVPGTLASLGKAFFPNDPSRQKFENETIKGLTRDEYEQLDQVQLKDIEVYCN